MARLNAIVCSLPSVETLGCTTKDPSLTALECRNLDQRLDGSAARLGLAARQLGNSARHGGSAYFYTRCFWVTAFVERASVMDLKVCGGSTLRSVCVELTFGMFALEVVRGSVVKACPSCACMWKSALRLMY